MPTLDQFSTLLASFYRGPRENPPWGTFLNQLCELLGARCCVVNLSRPRPGDPGITFIGGTQYDSANQMQYANEYAALDPFVNLPDGEAITLEEMMPLAQLQQTAYYHEFMLPTDNTQLLGIDIHRGSSAGVFLRAIRSDSAPPFGDREKALFNLLAPHLRQLQDWLDRDKREQLERGLYDGMARRLEVGTILLDASARVVYSNPVARLRLETGMHLRSRGGRLVAVRGSDNRRLQEAITSCLEETRAPSLTQAITLAGEAAAGDLFLLVRPLPAEVLHHPAGGESRANRLHRPQNSGEEPRIAIYMSTPEPLSPEQQGILQQLFDFTPSEARLAISLANGMSLDEIAEALNVTRNTLRTHLRGAFQKAGVNQQSALVSLVLRAVAGLG